MNIILIEYQAAKNRVKTYSGGMKRRLSVAISSICNPKLLFFDEPVSNYNFYIDVMYLYNPRQQDQILLVNVVFGN